jgi:hypothetical protein
MNENIRAEWEIELEETGKVEVYSRLNEAQRIVEAIADTHLAISMSNDVAIADGRGPVYSASQTLFKAAIMAAYPDLSAESIYGMWTDTHESIEYCAAWFMKEAAEATPIADEEWEGEFTEAERTHVHIQHDDTLREMIIPRYLFEQAYAMCGWGILGSMTAEDAKMLNSYKK